MLESINSPKAVKKLDADESKILADEIRRFLIDTISNKGGHLASNLGVVELVLGLVRVFDFPKDSIVFDVGHQSYVYKILTGRREGFERLRERKGLSGFPIRSESIYDCFGTGHASTSIAAANGIATAKKMRGDNSHTIAFIGDGALTGGLALEALNNLVSCNNKLIIILNDNEMSIDKNVGYAGLSLGKLRVSRSYLEFKDNVQYGLEKIPFVGERATKQLKKVKNTLKKLMVAGINIEDLGLKYYGPFDGHDLVEIVYLLRNIRRMDRPVIIHFKTQKGRGYLPAINNPSKFHGIGPFDKISGNSQENSKKSYTEVFEDALLDLANGHSNVIAITAAMMSSTGLGKMKSVHPNRVVDVGIAEGYALTYAAGLSAGGVLPVVAIYSTFLQRAYDQIIHDVCIQNLPMIFAIDRAGIVGKDGATHQGVFDISFLNGIPNMNILAPANAMELSASLEFAYGLKKPIAIRYPRGEACVECVVCEKIELGKSVILKHGNDAIILALGSMVEVAKRASQLLEEKGLRVGVVNMRFAKPLDTDLLDTIGKKGTLIITIEEGIIRGGFGDNVLRYINSKRYNSQVYNLGIPDKFIPHGSPEELLKELGLDYCGVCEYIENILDRG